MHIRVLKLYIYYEIVLEVQTTNKHMHNLTSADQTNHIGYSKGSKVIKREITVMDEQ